MVVNDIRKTGQSAPGPHRKSNHINPLISATVNAFRGYGFSLLVTVTTHINDCSGYGDSSGKSEKVETPQGAKRTRRLGLARGKRPSGTEINNPLFLQNI